MQRLVRQTGLVHDACKILSPARRHYPPTQTREAEYGVLPIGQLAISSDRWGSRRTLPCALTELGF